MIVVMQREASEREIEGVIERMVELGFDVRRTTGVRQTVLAGIGLPAKFDVSDLEGLAGVQDTYRISAS